MPPMQLDLNEGCAARLPNVNIRPGITGEEAKTEYTRPILVLILASARLQQDLEIYVQRWPYKQSGIYSTFD